MQINVSEELIETIKLHYEEFSGKSFDNISKDVKPYFIKLFIEDLVKNCSQGGNLCEDYVSEETLDV